MRLGRRQPRPSVFWRTPLLLAWDIASACREAQLWGCAVCALTLLAGAGGAWTAGMGWSGSGLLVLHHFFAAWVLCGSGKRPPSRMLRACLWCFAPAIAAVFIVLTCLHGFGAPILGACLAFVLLHLSSAVAPAKLSGRSLKEALRAAWRGGAWLWCWTALMLWHAVLFALAAAYLEAATPPARAAIGAAWLHMDAFLLALLGVASWRVHLRWTDLADKAAA